MGRYVYGSQGFFYKYVFGEQPTNLRDLGDWAGAGSNRTTSTFKTQLYLAHDEANEQTLTFIDGAGPLTCVYEAVLTPADLGVSLSPDFESAIYQIADDWRRVVAAIDRSLPGTAFNPDLCLAHSYSFAREHWPALATRIGHGADPADLGSLKAAREAVFESREGDYLPLLAVNALIHAVERELDRVELVDGDEGHTNLWTVVFETAGPYDPDASWEERALHARMRSFDYQLRPAAVDHLEQLITERPAALSCAQALFACYLWDDRWDRIGEVAGRGLDASPDEPTRAALHRWRGEARWNAGDMDGARADAEAAEALGLPQLRIALDQA